MSGKIILAVLALNFVFVAGCAFGSSARSRREAEEEDEANGFLLPPAEDFFLPGSEHNPSMSGENFLHPEK